MSIKRVMSITVAAAVVAGLVSCGGSKTAVAAPSAAQAAAPTSDPAYSEAQAQTADGFEVVSGPEAVLDSIKSEMNKDLIPNEVGNGSSNRENIALEKAESDARAKLARAVDVLVQELRETEAVDVNDRSEELSERVRRELTNTGVTGATTYKKIKLFNKESGQYKYFVLMYIDPQFVKNIVEQEIDRIDRDTEAGLRIKKAVMLRKLDAAIEKYRK